MMNERVVVLAPVGLDLQQRSGLSATRMDGRRVTVLSVGRSAALSAASRPRPHHPAIMAPLL